MSTAACLYSILCIDFFPRIPPPQFFLNFSLSLNKFLKFWQWTSNYLLSSGLKEVKAKAVAVFLWTSYPSLALPLIKPYGTSFFLQRAGKHITNSIGSTSCAMITSWAYLDSINWVICLSPYLRAYGFLPSSFLFSILFSAYLANLCFFSALDSGIYFFNVLIKVLVWAASRTV